MNFGKSSEVLVFIVFLSKGRVLGPGKVQLNESTFRSHGPLAGPPNPTLSYLKTQEQLRVDRLPGHPSKPVSLNRPREMSVRP